MQVSEAQRIIPDAETAPKSGRSLWQDAVRRLRRDPAAMICLGIIVLYAMVAVGGAVYEYVAERNEKVPVFADTQDFDNLNKPPSLEKFKWWMGTDWAGKSVLYKTLLGAKVSLTVGLMANVIAIPLGMILGAIAGYYGGRIDDLVVWMYTTLSSVPGIILLIAMKFAFEGRSFLGLDMSGIHGLYIALGVISWIGTCRLVRAETMKIRELDYVLAARAIGTSDIMILLRHVLPNVTHIAIINFSLGFVGAIKAEVILSFLGLGVGAGVPSWGSMINAARLDIQAGRLWELTAAVGAMFFLVLALNIFGDRLRDALDPKLRNV